MSPIKPHTVAELIYWSYANLAMAHDGIARGLPTYDKTSFIIRMRMYKGLLSGKMQISTLFKDERWKMENGARCVYCGTTENLSVDHLFPRIKGGADNVENLICSCKSCNSSKGKKDLMAWYRDRNRFPSIMVLRRYLKLVHQQCQELGIMEKALDEVEDSSLPFSLSEIPTNYPKCSELSLL
ncbi:MAG: HNH endonuclease [Bacteroidales bacterium]|nr:HNH endonuclease [Bacteroidales bacterium]